MTYKNVLHLESKANSDEPVVVKVGTGDTYAYVQKGGVLEFEPVLPDEMVLPVTKSEGVPVSPSNLADSVERFISEGDTDSIPDGVQVLVIARDGNPNHTEAHAVVDDGAVSSYGSLKTN